jgi:plasmid stabilization system protein ParE
MNLPDGLGFDFLADVQFGIDSLCLHPYLGHAIGQGLRRKLLHRFPFSLIYSVETDAILIVAVAHYGRRPGYWKTQVTG